MGNYKNWRGGTRPKIREPVFVLQSLSEQSTVAAGRVYQGCAVSSLRSIESAMALYPSSWGWR